MVNNCCCAFPRQEAAASLCVSLLYCQVGPTAPPKIVAGAAEAVGNSALHSLLVWLNYQTKFRVFLPQALSAFACWMSLQAHPDSQSLPWCHQVLRTLCWQGTFLGGACRVCTEGLQDTFPHLAGAWCSLLCLMDQPGAPRGASQCCWPVVMLLLCSSLGPWSYRGFSNFPLKFWGIPALDLQGKPAAARSLAHLLNQASEVWSCTPQNWVSMKRVQKGSHRSPGHSSTRNPDQPRAESAEAVELSLFSK